MIVDNLGMLLKPSARSKAYLQKLVESNIKPHYVLLMQNPVEARDKIRDYKTILKENLPFYSPFDINQPELYTLEENSIDHELVQASSFNDPQIIETLKKRQEDYFIFSGLDILKKDILNIGKRFIHIHPGRLPDYKGSTCIYYSILNEDKCYASAFFMTEKIDSGHIIALREFEKPKKEDITSIYDPNIRAELLVDVVRKLVYHGHLESKIQDLNNGETYFIIHPILEHLVNLYCKK